MSLHKPYFFIKEKLVCHNCDGATPFMATDSIDTRTERLLTLAIEEGKRQKAEEIKKALGLK